MKRPPLIETKDDVRQKMDNLLVLGDIELAQTLQHKLPQKAIQVGFIILFVYRKNSPFLLCKIIAK